jgi:hypothetical protein
VAGEAAHVVPGSVAVAAPDVDAVEFQLRKVEGEGRTLLLLLPLSGRLGALVHRDAGAVHLCRLDLDPAEEQREKTEPDDDLRDASVEGRIALTLGRHAHGHSLDLHAEGKAVESGREPLPADGRSLALRSHLHRLGFDEVLGQEEPRGEVDEHHEPHHRSEDNQERPLEAGHGRVRRGGLRGLGHGSAFRAALGVERADG